MRRYLLLPGLIALLIGLVWIGQGTGVLPYPAESFMIDDSRWARNGAVLAIVGIGMVAYSRRVEK